MVETGPNLYIVTEPLRIRRKCTSPDVLFGKFVGISLYSQGIEAEADRHIDVIVELHRDISRLFAVGKRVGTPLDVKTVLQLTVGSRAIRMRGESKQTHRQSERQETIHKDLHLRAKGNEHLDHRQAAIPKGGRSRLTSSQASAKFTLPMTDTNYLTPAAYEALRAELKELLDVERPKIVSAVSDAAAMGDRSENAEYIYGKRRLREIDRRIRFLQKRLESVEVVDPAKIDISKVSFGAWVKVADEEGEERWYQIVGQDEIDPQAGRITFSSPLGRALLGKRVGDIAGFQAPRGPVEYEVLEIRRARGK